MKLTVEQEAIASYLQEEKRNLLITARAGCAKTTTLEFLMKETTKKYCYLVFNRSAMQEVKDKGVRGGVYTFNGIGHKAWTNFCPARVNLDSSKVFKLVKEHYNGEHFREVMDVVRAAKQLCYVPFPTDFSVRPKSLISTDEFYNTIPYKFDERITTDSIIQESLRLAYAGTIDFDDQILCCAIWPVRFDNYSLVFVDEAQDLSPANHAMLKRIVSFNRIVAVGDDAQAIYGFRGADKHSMKNLQQQFKMDERKLTTTFRCAKNIVSHANWRTRDMKPAEWAEEGIVRELDEWTESDLSGAVLCRNNLPLIRLALSMIANGRSVKMTNRDILSEFSKLLKKFGSKNDSLASVLDQIEIWAINKARVVKNTDIVHDKAECMKLLCSQSPTLRGVQAHIRNLQNSDGLVTLSTVHKAKGLEWDTVYILDEQAFGDGGQENNLRYVAQTRAKKELYYIKSSNKKGE